METQDRLTVVDQNLKKIDNCSLLKKFNSLVESAESKFGLENIAKFKATYFQKYGKVFPDDHNYHERINYFLDQLVFETPISETKEIYRQFDDEAGIHGFLHSVFAINKIKDSEMELLDLLSEHYFTVDITEYKNLLLTAEKNDIFQGFLYFNKNNDKLIPSQGILFHPKRCRAILKKHIKTAKKTEGYKQDELLSRLAKCQIKLRRMRHLKPRTIYKELEKSL